MSARSPQFVRNASSPHRDFEADLSNVYLSPEVDPEQADFQASGIRLTPVNDEDGESVQNGPISPLDPPANSASASANNEGCGTSYSDFLSPIDDFPSDLSAHTSPGAESMLPSMWQDNDTTNLQNIQTRTPDRFGSVSGNPSSPRITMDPSQLLTPNLTNNPSPSSDTTGVKSPRVSHFAPHSPVPRLITTLSDSLGPQAANDAARAISPIVKVESYSRGDSPVRDSFAVNRRPSQSSVHLSPGGLSNGSEDGDGAGEERRSIPRAPNGAWIPNSATGHAGVDPNARENVYILSPNEVESQRKLAEKNKDIKTWSEAVSDANSEAGDDYLPSQRGRREDRGTRPRAKSTGDPSLQSDYFSLRFHGNEHLVPGPGYIIRETSDVSDASDASDDGTESSPAASVNEEGWTQEAPEITPSEHQNPESEGPLPHQFLRTSPWQDPGHDSSPRTTQTQPASSNQAMVEFQRRARELDAISRWATWGTDANSIRSFQNLSLNERGKKHERRNSLLKFLEKKQPNILKRQRQPTDLSVTQPGTEGTNKGTGTESTPQRKNSFPHRKLSLGLSSKSPTYSAGGALIAISQQMAAVGGKDSLKVASPGSATGPWASLKRGRSRSEVPRVRGLVELMASHGGPPVPNIHYSTPATENEGPRQIEQDHDTGDDDDDDDHDVKSFVMEFPILPNLPVPTLPGFKAQIIQLNPRLADVLVERFAQEQVRRYKNLIKCKSDHATSVSQRTCKAGKYCFAQGGKAKPLPPRASSQDAEFTNTQFQIPGRGETDESPEALGETAIATAQFPPGVPYPPPQVKILPAEFECPVCFQVKKFQKPSDWTKHIYEDVQPFTCTFPDCNEPKSFKRKADWVRHENEKHRQLEWWECTFGDCRHRCYRKDNFVQHLVREHKMPDPKFKKSKNKGSGGKSPNGSVTPRMQEEINREQEIKRLWGLVESCRHETTKDPRDEPCRFCGNICTSWKKLMVHLGKHMEQIAIPILGLVDERDFPYGNGAYSIGEAHACDEDTSSGQISVTHGTSSFTPSVNGTTDGLSASMNFTQAQYASHVGSHVGGSQSLPVPFDPNTACLAPTTLSIEATQPNSLNNMVDVSTFGEQTRLMIPTYPPLSNAGLRPTVSNQDLRVLADYNNFTTSPTEMQYDPQSDVYVSDAAQNRYTYNGPMASAMPYSGPGPYQGQHQ